MKSLSAQTFVCAVALACAACSGKTEQVSIGAQTAEGMAVAATIDTMFLALGSADTALFRQTVTDDFYIFEHAKWNMDSVMALMPLAVGMRWKRYNTCVTMSGTLAHVTYENYPADSGGGWWLENALLLQDGGRWRVAFLQSTRMPAPVPGSMVSAPSDSAGAATLAHCRVDSD